MPRKSDSLERAPKRIRNPDFDPKLACTPHASIDKDSLNICTKKALNVTTSSYNEDHLAKCFCLAKSSKEHVSQKHKNTISNSLASRIGERTLWDKEDDTVSLGSQTHKTLDHDESTLSVMSTNDSLFADNGLRCTAFPYKREYSTNLHSVLECWMMALNCSDRKYCSLTHVLKNARIKLCPHRLASSACQNCKDKKLVPVEITPFWILDSGASLHFTGEKRDFVTFQELPIPFPIHTANGSTHITGKGSVVLKHLNSKNQEVTTNVPSVFFCEDLTW